MPLNSDLLWLIFSSYSKSQLAIEYCYRFREKNPKASVFWLHGSVDRFPQAYREIARRADIPVANGDPLELVTEWLNDPRSGQWLLVIDNADDVSAFFGSKSKITESRENLKPLARYVPHGSNGFILITTRDSRVGERLCNREKPIQVLPMNAAEAEDLLRSKISDDLWVEEDARELLQDLAYLPLAITQAAAFISENNQTISEYLRILRMGDGDLQELLSEDLEDPRRDLDTDNSVMRTWKISFDQILKEKPRAADVLSLMAVLERSGVPEVLLRSTGESETGFKTALGTLQAFSLITGDKGKSLTFSMHRLVQLTTQKWLELRGGLSRWQAEALRVLSVVYPEPSYQTWVECESFAPHVQLVLSYPFPSDAAALHRANLLSKRCMFEFDMGRLHTSQEDGSEARTLHERLCSEDDPVLLRDLYLHGIWHESQGDNVQAKELFARAASGFEKVLGIAHKYTSESIQNLGCVLVRLGEYEAAEKVITRALDTQEKLCGPNARSVLLCMQSLGSLMMARDDFEGAEKILREARKRYEVTLGSDHVETLDCLTLLAIVLTEEWNPEAVSLLETVVDALENKLGPNQMETIRAIVRLSEAICIMSDNDAAEALLRGALVRQDSLHTPGSLILLHQLGVVLQRQLRLEESERMYRKVVAEEERVFGKEDANTLCTLTNLAQVLVDTGPERYAEAEGILREALVVWEATRGKSNETAIRWRTVLRNLLKLQDKQEEAASLIEGFDETQLPDNTKESGSRTMRQWAFAIPGRGGV